MPGAWLNEAKFAVRVEQFRPELVLCTLPPRRSRPLSRGGREREAKAYWDSLTPNQEAWVLHVRRGQSVRSEEAGRASPTGAHERYAESTYAVYLALIKLLGVRPRSSASQW